MHSIKRIAFIHIPKCAGTSVVQSIRETYFPRHRRLVSMLSGKGGYRTVTIGAQTSARAAEAIGESLQASRSVLLYYFLSDRSIAYVTGHVPFSDAIGREFAGKWDFVTIVRNPIERFFSEYFYNRFKPQEHFRVEAELDEFLETPEAVRQSSQLVNFLTGRRDVYKPPSDQEVALAIRNLQMFAVVGATESMDSFANGMGLRFGAQLRLRHVNRNPAPPELLKQKADPAFRSRVEALSAGDEEVYRAAVSSRRAEVL